MNYGKKSVSKKRNSLISRTAMMGKKSACFVDQSPVCCFDHNLRGYRMYRNRGFSRNNRQCTGCE